MPTCSRFSPISLYVSVILGLIFAIGSAPNCAGYAVLTHEAIIDAVWKDSLEPLLLSRFPNVTPEELLRAHGCRRRCDYPRHRLFLSATDSSAIWRTMSEAVILFSP